MRLTIIPSDRAIGIDGNFFLKIKQDLSWIPSDVHAVQWDGTKGHVEYIDDRPNLQIEELGIFEQAIIDYENEKKRIEDEAIALELARDYWEELRVLRNERLMLCDWTQSNDSPLNETQKELWRIYREELRDLPDNIDDPKPLVWDSNHVDWPVQPQ